MKKEGKFYCDYCGKEIDSPEDWFMVRNEIWERGVKKLGLSKRSYLCTDCFREHVLKRDIELDDLKLGSTGYELPINYWIIKKEAIKNPWRVMKERSKNIKISLEVISIKKKTMDLISFIKRMM